MTNCFDDVAKNFFWYLTPIKSIKLSCIGILGHSSNCVSALGIQSQILRSARLVLSQCRLRNGIVMFIIFSWAVTRCAGEACGPRTHQATDYSERKQTWSTAHNTARSQHSKSHDTSRCCKHSRYHHTSPNDPKKDKAEKYALWLFG